MMRRLVSVFLVLSTLVLLAPPARADRVWDLFQQAAAHEQAGRIDLALPLWQELAEAYGAQGDATNAAIFWKKLGKAYDGQSRRAEAVHAYEQEARYWEKAGHADWGKEDLLRADQLRTTVRLFVAEAAQPPRRPLGKHEPAAGALLGAYTERDPAVGQVFRRAEQAYGKHLAAFLVYFDYGRSDIDTYLRLAREAGAGLQIAFQPSGGLDRVADDPYLRGFARKLQAAGIPVFLRFAGEMNGDWVRWHTSPEKYIEKFRLVSRVMKAEAPDVAMVWAPNHLPENFDPYYPGDDAVDWVGLSMYQDFYASGDAGQPADRDSPADKVRYIHDKYGARKPIMIAEWGVAHREYTGPSDRTAWAMANLLRLYGALPRLYPNVKAVFYFSVDQKASPNPYTRTVWSSYLLTEKPAFLAAYRQAVSGAYYLPRPAATAPVAYRELAAPGARLAPGTHTLSAYVKLYDPIVSKVEYLVDGQFVGAAEAAPYDVTHDFSGYGGRRVTVTVRAYNAAGAPAAEATVPVLVGDAPLTDLQGHWAAAAIRDLVGRGIVSGYPDSTFRPDAAISREAFFKLMAAALGLAPGAGVSFRDLPPERWSYPYAAALAHAGVLRPDEFAGGLLEPHGDLPRQEMAALLARAAGLSPGAPPGFTDAQHIRAEWRPLVGAAVARGLLAGFPDGRFGPRNGASRAEATVVIMRLLNLLGK